MWARRLIVGTSLAVASLAMVPGIAGADSCTPAGSVTEPGGCVTTPVVSTTPDPTPVAVNSGSGNSGSGTATTVSTSSLPFTGADVAELALVGSGAVLAGGLLMRRRRRAIA
jgi:LPXTG-motif cell wall-anchored protein